MKTILTKRSVLAALLLGWAAGAGALSLGPVNGATVMGRPLELSAAIGFDDLAQASGAGCVSAEVFYGDRALDRGRIHLSVAQDAARQVSTARISSPAQVDEPFVTLVLRAGCARPSTRRYVLLADAPGEAPVALGATTSLSPENLSAVQRPSRADSRTMGAGPAKTAKVYAKLRERRVAEHPLSVVRTAAAFHHGGRLRLAVWDPAADASPWLRTSGSLRSAPFADAPHRAAASALWGALNAQPQDLLRTAERLRGLEGEVSSLRVLADQHRSEISTARDSLTSARNNRNLTLLLALMLPALAGAAGAFFWNRQRHGLAQTPYASWYPPVDPHEDLEVEEDEEEVALPALVEKPADRAPLVPEPIPALTVAPPVREPQKPAQVKLLPPEGPAVPAEPPLTVGLKTDALHGAHQQAEFFASLGQVDEAVAVLSDYIRECSEKPVLAFLELLRIYRLNGMRTEYEELQSQFRLAFDADTMSFSEYKDDDRELDMFPVAMGRVAGKWPSLRSLEVIEELLFKKPATPREMLSYAAYRDLLWLSSLGQELVQITGLPAGLQLRGDRGLPNDHFILPWAVSEDGSQELSLDRLSAIDVAPGSSAFGVDIDLTAVPGEAMKHSWHDANTQPAVPAASPPPAPVEASTDAFDLVMESFSRKSSPR